MPVYKQPSLKGARLPGWEDLNAQLLAEDLQVGPQHLRQVLTGRHSGRLLLLQRVARALDMTMDAVLARIEAAKVADRERKLHKQERREERLRQRRILGGGYR